MPTNSCLGKAVAALAAGMAVAASTVSVRAQCTYLWEPVASNNTPAARYNGAMVYDEAREELVLIAGSTAGSANQRQTWTYAAGLWTLRTSASPVGTFFASCYDRARQRVVVFGGLPSDGAGIHSGNTYEWDGAQWHLVATTGPVDRAAAAMCYDSVRNVCVLFGGTGESAAQITLNDTWEWNGAQWTQRHLVGPPARYMHQMAFDEARGETVLFGGTVISNPTELCDTWAYDGNRWQQVARAGPGSRFRGNMAYDPTRGSIVYVGGNGRNRESSDTWLWNGSRWVLAGIGTLPNRDRSTLAYVPSLGGLVCFGGRSGGSSLGDFRVLRSSTPLVPIAAPEDRILAEGSAVSFSVPIIANSTYEWTRYPANLANGPSPFGSHVSGVTTAVLNITGAQRGDTGLLNVEISTPCGRASISQLLVVLCPADFDEDENVTADDLAEYINDYFSGLSMRTDFNHDGVIDSEDLIEYINSYFGPCR